MIVYQKEHWFKIFMTTQGGVLNHIWRRLLVATVFALVLTLLFDFEYLPKALTITPLPFTLIGLPLSIFLGFRNNSSYDRYWEGRKLWGSIINTTRTATRQIMTLVEPTRGGVAAEAASEARVAFEREQVMRLMGYIHALRHHLRDERSFEDCKEFVSAEEYARFIKDPNPPIALLHRMGERFGEAWRAGWIDTMHMSLLEKTLTMLTDLQGGCERIKKTPIPFAYTVLMHRIVGVYCFMLPFGVYKDLGDLTPVVVLMISYAFFGLDAIGDEVEEPFGLDMNDLPLSSFSRMLEIEAKTRLGVGELPRPIVPVDRVLY
jgi:putative membrane protein